MGFAGVVVLLGIDVAGDSREVVGATLTAPAQTPSPDAILSLIALGVALLDEEIGVGAIAGLLLILAGSCLATGGRPPGSRTRNAQIAVPQAGSVRSHTYRA